LAGHLAVEFKELFKALGIVLKTAPDVDPFEDFVIALVRGTEVIGHLFRIIQIGYRCGKMRFAGEKNIFGAAG